jgi:tRNA pseudouridine55 synthase
VNGVLVLDKPPRMSSAQAVDHVKKRLGVKRAGHGGTLDPIATGVLPICLGEATKLAAYLLADDKAYEADALLGIETDTLDRTGNIVATRPCDAITREHIEVVLASLRGEHDQVPPMYSAIKQGGVRMYHRARAGEEVERTPRRVRIDQLELLAFEPPVIEPTAESRLGSATSDTASIAPALPSGLVSPTSVARIKLAIACSKGTYVRSLIADIGTALGCGAHMTQLRRTRSGHFTLAMAHDLDRLDNLRLVPLTEATQLPIVVSPADLVSKVRSGLQLPPELFPVAPENFEKFQLFDPEGRLVAIAHVDGNRVIYDRVFAA